MLARALVADGHADEWMTADGAGPATCAGRGAALAAAALAVVREASW
jgi:hypothetical protein